MMKVVYANQALPHKWFYAIFLAGPTPRLGTTLPSWRPDALKHLEESGYDGVVFVPENEDGTLCHNHDNQIEWEEKCLNFADVIIFWIPRELQQMPAFTTNDEWGYWKAKDPMKLILGTPDGAPKVSYQRFYARKYNIPTHNSLEATCAAAVEKLGDVSDAARKYGERSVPLHVWRTPSFKSWYKKLVRAGNRLDDAEVEWIFRVGPTQQIVLFWILHVDVYIAAEGRNKTDEVVISRPDISSILLYERRSPIRDSRIVIVKRFCSSVSNNDGYVYELAGGSSCVNKIPYKIAMAACHEQAGLRLASERFIMHQARQVVATTLTNRARLFSAELTIGEMDEVAKNAHVGGVEGDTERTWASVMTYGDILEGTKVDWSMLGMVASILQD